VKTALARKHGSAQKPVTNPSPKVECSETRHTRHQPQNVNKVPHQSCSICRHEQREAIDFALRTNACSLRVLAGQFGASKTALGRHRHHLDGKKDRANTKQIAQIDDEIRRLKRAQTAARKRRDNPAFVRLSGELRQWHMLKSKLAGSMLPEKDAPVVPISEHDAPAMAIAIIEMNLAEDQRQQVCEWLNGVVERLRPADAVPAGPNEPLENGDISGTVEI
jgi:hypothetical protein